MKNTKFRKLLTAFAITFAFAAGGLTAAPAAEANTGGGIGGGGGPGGAYSGFQWVSVAYAQKGQAYEQFVKLSGWDRGTVEREVRNRVGNLDVCKNSNVIWFIASQGWTYNFTGWTWPSNYAVAGTIENPRVKVGERGASAAEVQAFKDWDWNTNGRKIAKTPGYTIICSGAFKKPDLAWTTTGKNQWNGTDSDSWTQPYSWTTEVKRQITEGGKDPIGVNNLRDQPGVTQKTAFGELYDSLTLGSGKGMNPEQLRAAVQTAINKDKTRAHAAGDLIDKNKEGMAEGGVLNVQEQTKNATISTTRTTTYVDTTTCNWSQRWNTSTGNYNAATSNCSTNRTSSEKSTATRSQGTQQNTGFWQMLSVHCNKAEFDALMAADPSIIKVAENEASGVITAVVHTKKYNTKPADKDLDFGSKTNSNPAKAKTGTLGFYDKECPFDCVPVGTTTGNATSDTISGNNFEFFRDNSAKKITMTPWAPSDARGVTYDPEKNDVNNTTTTITRWTEGTPSVEGTEGGKFSMKTAKGVELFTGGNGALPVQKNWDKSTFSKSNATLLKGIHTDFTVQSSWASAAGKPQVMNAKWEYAPSVSTTFPSKGIGFGAASAKRLDSMESASTAIEGKCYANFKTGEALNTVGLFGKGTGTGTSNTLDASPVQGVGTPPESINSNLVTNFVRATTQ